MRAVRDAEQATVPLLSAGSTCWRIERAERLALLVDNQTYFAAVCAALRRAQRSVLLLGWEFDPRTTLVPDAANPRESERIGDVLRALHAQRPQVDIRVLIWDMALPISLARGRYPQRARQWFDGGVDLRLDDDHPAGACHHQKVVVIDDALAFCSGGDFNVNRWDSSAHADHDPRRRLPSGKRHPPRHGVTLAVDGNAAAALGDLARTRWQRATGERLARPADGRGDPWPVQMACELRDCAVGIARTEPAYDGRAAVSENEALYMAAIGAAQRLLYLENQYLASMRIGEALKSRLAEPDGPEIVVILPRHAPGYFDRLSMDGPRDVLIRELAAADRYGRFHAYSPVTAADADIIVHSKVTIVDDRLLRAGSANISNRSMGFDTECDVAVDAALGGAETRRTIERVLHRLVAHYMDARPEEVAQAIAPQASLAAAIQALQRPGANRLARLCPPRPGLVRSTIAKYHVGDPRSAAESFRPWRRA